MPQASFESEQELDGQVRSRPQQFVTGAILAPTSCARTPHLAFASLLIKPCKAVRYPQSRTGIHWPLHAGGGGRGGRGRPSS